MSPKKNATSTRSVNGSKIPVTTSWSPSTRWQPVCPLRVAAQNGCSMNRHTRSKTHGISPTAVPSTIASSALMTRDRSSRR